MKRSTLLRTGSIAVALLLTACTSSVYRYAELDEHAYFYVKNETGQPYFNTLVYADNTSCSKPQKLYLSKLDDNWRASPKNNRPYGPARIKADQTITFGVRVSDGPGIHCHAVASFVPEYRKTYLAVVRNDANGSCAINIQQAIDDGKSKKLITLKNTEQRSYSYLTRRCSASGVAPASVGTGQQLNGFSANDVGNSPENSKDATESAIRIDREEAIFKPENAKAARLSETTSAPAGSTNKPKLYIPEEKTRPAATSPSNNQTAQQRYAPDEPVQYQGDLNDRYAEWKKRKEGGLSSDADAYQAPKRQVPSNTSQAAFEEGLKAQAAAEAEASVSTEANAEKRGFWSKMAFWKSSPAEKEAKAAAKKAKQEAKAQAKQAKAAKNEAEELEDLARAAEEEAEEMEQAQ